MKKFNVIAVEKQFLISFIPFAPINTCLLINDDIYISSRNGNLFLMKKYDEYIEFVNHAVKEGRYEWTDFCINEDDIVCKDFNNNIIVNNKIIEPFSKLDDTGNKKISNTTLKLFNSFLKSCNKDNADMVEALSVSFSDGFFRTEVDSIIKYDSIDELSNLDKEIIVRCKAENTKYIKKYVNELLNSNDYDKYININYFFRRIFILEKFNYLNFYK